MGMYQALRQRQGLWLVDHCISCFSRDCFRLNKYVLKNYFMWTGYRGQSCRNELLRAFFKWKISNDRRLIYLRYPEVISIWTYFLCLQSSKTNKRNSIQNQSIRTSPPQAHPPLSCFLNISFLILICNLSLVLIQAKNSPHKHV